MIHLPKSTFRLLLALCLYLSGSCILQAQNNSKKALSEVLAELESTYNIRFSLDPEMIAGDSISVSTIENSKKLKPLLNVLESETNYRFQKIDNSNVIVIPKSYSSQNAICVILLDEETQEPIPGVMANSKQGSFLSDINGKISFSGEINPDDSLTFSMPGYAQKTIRLGDLLNAPCQNIALPLESEILQEVVIHGYIAPGINSLVNDFSLEIKPQELALLPGQTSGDVLQSISTLPGISSPNTKAGNLHIRGSSTDQTLVYFDNIPLYNKGHYFGTISPFNQQVIEQIKVYRSGSHPRLGGRVGGTIEIKTENTAADSLEASVGVSMTNVMAYTHIPIVRNKLSVLVGGRYALPSSLNTPTQKSLSDFLSYDDPFTYTAQDSSVSIQKNEYHFEDFNGKVIYDIAKGHQLSLSVLHTKSYQKRQYARSRRRRRRTRTRGDEYSDHYIGGKNNGVNLQLSNQLTKNTKSTLSFTVSNYNNLTDLKTLRRPSNDTTNIKYFDTSIKEYSLKTEFRTYTKKQVNYFDYGYNLERYINSIDMVDYRPNRPIVNNLTQQSANVHSVYANFNIRSINKLSLNIGGRSSYYTITEKVYWEPRLFANYTLVKNFSLKASYGWYHQYIQQLIFFDFNDIKPENFNWGLSTIERPPVRSMQTMFGFLWTPAKTWTIDVEVYNKDISPVHISGGIRSNGQILFEGDANMKGADFMIKKEFKKLDLWLSYSLSEVTWVFDTLSQERFYAYYDQRHNLNLNAIYRIKKWSFSGSWSLRSGLPKQDVTVTIPPPTPNNPQQEIGYNYLGRTPWHHQLDVSVAYDIRPKNESWNALISVSFFNVYDQKTLVYEDEIRPGVPFSAYTLGFMPNAQMIINF